MPTIYIISARGKLKKPNVDSRNNLKPTFNLSWKYEFSQFLRLRGPSFFTLHTSFVAGFSRCPPDLDFLPLQGIWNVFPAISINGLRVDFLITDWIFIYTTTAMFTTCFSCHLHTRFVAEFSCRTPYFSFLLSIEGSQQDFHVAHRI